MRYSAYFHSTSQPWRVMCINDSTRLSRQIHLWKHKQRQAVRDSVIHRNYTQTVGTAHTRVKQSTLLPWSCTDSLLVTFVNVHKTIKQSFIKGKNRRLSRKRYNIGRWLLWKVNMTRRIDIRVGYDDLDWCLTHISRWPHFWSRISKKRRVIKTKLL